ncbi:hypothetical protein Tco_0102244 [Tanacetum coccineum]
MHKLKTGKEGETKYEMKIPEVMLNVLIKEKQAYKVYMKKCVEIDVSMVQPQPVDPTQGTNIEISAQVGRGHGKCFMKKGNFAVNAGKEKKKIVEDEQRRRDELMARERQTSLIIGREVEKGVDDAYRSDYSRP